MTIMKSILRLPLKNEWFKMTKAGIKREDYREINDYWSARLLDLDKEMTFDILLELIQALNNPKRRYNSINECLCFFGASFKNFQYNVMTLGYPADTDRERILTIEHKGIEIRTGRPEWGAEPDKLYFVILHGEIIDLP